MTSKSDRIRALESEQENLGDSLEGADLWTILNLISEHQDSDNLYETLNSTLFTGIIENTQSNPKESYRTLLRMVDIDAIIERIDQT